jgi:hypothetical protein
MLKAERGTIVTVSSVLGYSGAAYLCKDLILYTLND